MSSTTNQETRYRNVALTNGKLLVRSGPTDIYGWVVNNPNASEVFVQVFDAASTGDVALGTTICDLPIKVGPSAAVVFKEKDPQFSFSLGCAIAATTTEGGSTAPGTAVSIVLCRK